MIIYQPYKNLHFFLDDKNLNSRHRRQKWVAKVWVAQWARRGEIIELPSFLVVTIHNSRSDSDPENYWKTRDPVTDHLQLFRPDFILFCSASSLPVSSSSRSVDRAAPVPCPVPRLGPGDEAVMRSKALRKWFRKCFYRTKNDELKEEIINVSVEFAVTSRMCLHSSVWKLFLILITSVIHDLHKDNFRGYLNCF